LPILINPGHTEKLILRAISSINTTLNDNLELEPCNILQGIKFNIQKSNITVAAKDNNIDFGIIPLCTTQGNYETEGELIVTGGSISIKSIENVGDFTADFSIDEIISGNHKFKIRYSGNQPGKVNGKIKITFDPCLYEVEFNITAENITPSVTLNPDNLIDYGVVKTSLNSSQNLTITNNAPFEVELNFAFSNPKFSLNPANQNPIKFKSLESKIILIDFFSITEGIEEDGIVELLLTPCDIKYSLNLKAITSNSTVSGILEVQMPDKISGKIGETVKLPIRVTPQEFELKEAKINKATYFFRYNGIQIYPNNAKSLNPAGWAIGSSVVLTENSLNSSTLVLNFNDLPNPLGNQWLDINLELLLLQSQIRNDMIYLDSIVFESAGKLIAKIDSTEIEILDNCELQNRNITFDNLNQVPKVNQKGDKLYIEFYTIADGDVSIKLVGVNGEVIHSKDYNDVKHGNYSTNFDISNLQSGVYFIEVRTPTGVFTQKVLILK
jgi:hypothetical protein